MSEATDCQAQYDEYWARHDRVGESSGDLEQTADQIVMSCGIGRTLDIGSGEGVLVGSLLRRGVDAHGLDVSEVVVSRCNQRIPDRFTQGSVLSLPFADESFQTVVSTDCMEHLAPEDVPTALKEIYRVARRNVFLKLATTPDRDSHWHLTVEGRAWWETKCFEAGFRKHPAYYRINAYESLNWDGWQIVIPLEKIPPPAALQFPLVALQEERDLHMDMLREHGNRSDAHGARYHYASRYVRPGDIVIDAACGLGYGTHVIRSLTRCSTVTGIDGSAYAVDYASANFAGNGTTQFVRGTLPECIRAMPDNSVDCVICFETLEHVEAPTALLAEFHRILTPGGRLLASVPHDWSDETGRDPNPFHFHVYTRARFIAELARFFEIERLDAQTADQIKKPDTGEWVARPRSFAELDSEDEDSPVEAEWLLSLACKSPLNGENVPYVEKIFTQEEREASGNALAFARDYLNPWLVRSLVSIGLRTENRTLRARWATEVLRVAPDQSADYGAALCILAYGELSGSEKTQPNELTKLIDQYLLFECANPNVLRWQVSLSHVQGLISLTQGRRFDAERYFRRVIDYPVAAYSPTLLTKPAEAAYLLGLLYAADGRLQDAESVWSASLSAILGDIGSYLSLPYSALPPGFELREIAAALSIAGRLVAAIDHGEKVSLQPSIFHDEVNEDFVARLSWFTSQRDAWQQTVAERGRSIMKLQAYVQDLLAGNAWMTSQRDAWQQTAVEREQSIMKQQAYVQDLLAGNAWMTAQRDAWERIAAEREQEITALTSRLRETTEQLADREASLSRIRSHWATRLAGFLFGKGSFLSSHK